MLIRDTLGERSHYSLAFSQQDAAFETSERFEHTETGINEVLLAHHPTLSINDIFAN